MFDYQMKLTASELEKLVGDYDDPNERDALDAGRRIRNNDYTTSNLRKIVKWKSHRALTAFAKNSPIDIQATLEAVISTKSPRVAIAILCGLTGVAVPMASAVLTAIYPDIYTVIDYRAREALGEEKEKQPVTTIDIYLHYLEFCRKTAQKYNVTLRQLDRALWQSSRMAEG